MAFGAAGLAAVTPPGKLNGFALWTAAGGAAAIAVGAVLSDWFRQDAGWFLFMVGILAHALGLILFGIAGVHAQNAFWRSWLPVVVGLFGGPAPFLASFLTPGSADWPFMILIGALGGGWGILGCMLLISRVDRPAS